MSTAQNHQEIPPSNVKKLSIRTPTLYLTMSCITARETRHTKASTGRRLSLLPLGRHRRSFQPLTRTKKPSHPHHFHRNQSTKLKSFARDQHRKQLSRAPPPRQRQIELRNGRSSNAHKARRSKPSRQIATQTKNTNERTNERKPAPPMHQIKRRRRRNKPEREDLPAIGRRSESKRIEGRRTFANGFLC